MMEAVQDGWYDTCDIGRFDDEGIPISGSRGAVAGVPDDRKGERLVVIHTAQEEVLETVLAKLAGL